MAPVNPEPEWISGGPPTPPASRTGRRLAVAGVAAAALAVGGVAVAQAATSGAPTPSPSPPGASPAAPDRGPRQRGPHLAGTVVSASDGTITITDVEGFQRTIHTSSATTYSDGLTATPAAGTRIVAAGTVDSDKTALKATKIAKMPDRPGPGRGFPGGGPGGWPGRHHDRDGTPPSGSATPPAPPGPGTTSPGPSSPAPSTPGASPTS